MQGIKMVISDWDGTLDNSTESGINWVIEKTKSLHLHVPSYEFIRKLWGRPYKEVVIFIKERYKWSDIDLKRYYLDENRFNRVVNPFVGLSNFIFELRQRGMMLGIISSRDSESLNRNIISCNLNPSDFQIIQGFENCKFHKPDKRVFDRAIAWADICGFSKDQIVYLGDTLIDYETAICAGINFIAITSGATTKEEFVLAGQFHEHIFDSPVEIMSVLNLS